jgi:primosomal protein N' (replication factor Y)
MLLATVLLPFAFKSRFDYLVPHDLSNKIDIGCRVLVPFRKNDTSTGIVVALTQVERITDGRRLKYIQELLDEHPVVNQQLLALFSWMASYYLCSEGEILQASLPRGLKVQFETRVRAIARLQEVIADDRLRDEYYLLLEALELQGTLTLAQVKDLMRTENPLPVLRKLADWGWIGVDRHQLQGVQPRTVRIVASAINLDPEDQARAITYLNSAPKQQAVLQYLMRKGGWKIEKQVIEELGTSIAVIQALEAKGFIRRQEVPVNRVRSAELAANRHPVVLTPAQRMALHELKTKLEADHRPVLLLGVTGSGKTHIYIEMIRDALERGRQVLYLLPEIGLTKQIIDRLFAEFGEQVGVYHSRFSDAERVEIWQRILDGSYRVVIGVRSALLLPFDRLGLIVIDEEHDSSFKQQERVPLYNARDTAIYYAHLLGIPIILGSATPSIESYHHAIEGKYHLVRLEQRVHGLSLPKVEYINMAQQVENKLSHGQFSDPLIQELKGVLERGEQAIIFNHRRAYAPFVICSQCGHVPKCVYCDISLSFHKSAQRLSCHYCGYLSEQVDRCEVCNGFTLRHEGIGTERIVEQLSELFPQARIDRMDLDSTRGKHAFDELISRFEKHETDILVGTRMVTKGLDFDRVSLAAVVQADRLLHFPDFRAYEYAYQLLTQFSGRAGRSSTPGKVLIQTFQPDHPVLQLLQQPYHKFYEQEIVTRVQPAYPPFSRLILLELNHSDRTILEREGRILGNRLKAMFSGMMLGPEYPLIPRLKGQYRLHVLLKIKPPFSPSAVKKRLRSCIDSHFAESDVKTFKISIDVDPR